MSDKPSLTSSSLTDYDIEYDVIVENYDKYYHKNKNSVSAKTFNINQHILPTFKNFKLLKKSGYIGRFELGFLQFHKILSKSKLIGSVICVSIFGSTIFGLLFSLIALAVGSLNMIILGSAFFASIFLIGFPLAFIYELSNPFSVILKKINIKDTKSHTVVADDKTHSKLYNLLKNQELLKRLDKKTLQRLFKEFESSSFSVNEQIAKATRKREELLKEDKTAELNLILSELDKALDELFLLRDSDENNKLLEELELILTNVSKLDNDKKLNDGVSILSDITSFINSRNDSKINSEKNVELSQVIESLNKSDSSDDNNDNREFDVSAMRPVDEVLVKKN